MRVTLPGTKLFQVWLTRDCLFSSNQRSLVGHSYAHKKQVEKKEERTAHESGSSDSSEAYASWNVQAYHSSLPRAGTWREGVAAPPCAGIYDRVNPDFFSFIGLG